MKTAIPLATLIGIAASAAIAPALQEADIVDRHVHLTGEHVPTVDETSTRGQWVTSYSNNNNRVIGKEPTVDSTSTRGQWVTSSSNDHEPSVDETSTRGKWVSSYSNSKWSAVEHVDHWLPTGPAYLDMNDLEQGYQAHLMIMHDSSSWLHSGLAMVKRFLSANEE